jgi:multidrug transporter EmrE-like cation transporter
MISLNAWILLTVAIVLDTTGTVLLKQGVNHLPEKHGKGWSGWLALVTAALHCREILLGVAVYLLEYIAWLGFLSYIPLSVAYPMSSINNITILVASHFFLREAVGKSRWIGSLLIVAGIVLIGGTSA